MGYFREYPKKRLVKCTEAVDGLVVGETYTIYQEVKPKVWRDGWQVDDPNAPTLYTVCMNDDRKIEHVAANLFKIMVMKQVVYKGGWGSPHFACCWGEIHAPLEKDGIYDVIASEEIQTPGFPEYIYELRLPNGKLVEYANSAHFTDVNSRTYR